MKPPFSTSRATRGITQFLLVERGVRRLRAAWLSNTPMSQQNLQPETECNSVVKSSRLRLALQDSRSRAGKPISLHTNTFSAT